MRIFGVMTCSLSGHSPNRQQVRKTEKGVYLARCLHCGLPLRRLAREKWVVSLRHWREMPQNLLK